MKVCAIIVTYADRFDLLKQVLDYCSQNVDSIVLVNNNSSKNSRQNISEYQSSVPLNIVDFDYNTGSAKGFKSGIEGFMKSDCSHAIIFDDDNLAESGVLEKMKLVWEELPKNQEAKTALLANRTDRVNFNKVVLENNPEAILPPKNNFLGFHWKEFFVKLLERTSNKKAALNNGATEKIKVVAAPYSGLFFSKKLIENIGLPKEKYSLYYDDFDFTHQIYLQGGNIWLMPNCVINDIENSVYLPKKKMFFYHSLFVGKKSQMYYSFRNMLYFHKKYRIDNTLVFLINKFSFLVLIFFMAIINGELKKLSLLKDAIKDAKKEGLGANSNYPI